MNKMDWDIKTVILGMAIGCSSSVFSSPESGNVISGTGNISTNGSETTINQESDFLSIDWDSFDVSAEERVEFIQPGKSSIALNRILDHKGSEIHGRIDANGHVILVNPNGVLFGRDSVVNVGGLIASGLDIDPEDFINGEYILNGLEGTDGKVINSGLINASLGGNVALIGKQVDNDGLIIANLGRIHLAAGQQAVLTFDSAGLMGVQIDESTLGGELGEGAAVKNGGELVAQEGQILLNASTAKDVFASAVNWGEQKEARSVVYNEDGSFQLGVARDVENSGEINVSGGSAGDVILLGENVSVTGDVIANSENGIAGHIEIHSVNTTELRKSARISAVSEQSGHGGTVKLLGEKVGLFGSSSVDVSGGTGGGVALIGGGKLGQSIGLRNSKFVFSDSDVNISADAKLFGDGGQVYLFAEDTLRSYSLISAKGGASAGNGGFVETSGKIGLILQGVPNLDASNGKAGEWLIDPYSILVSQEFGEIDEIDGLYESSVGATRLLSGDLESSLERGITVTILTGEGGDSGQGNVVFREDLALSLDLSESSNDSTLNIEAHNNIQFQNNVSFSATGGEFNLNLQANLSNNTGGSITFGNNVQINTNGGDFTIGTLDSPGAYNVDLRGSVIDLRAPYYNTDTLDFLGQSGRLFVHAQNDVITALPTTSINEVSPIAIRGVELVDDLAKIELIAGNNIEFNGLLYDNNPTQTAADGNGYLDANSPTDSNNDGYSTLRMQAGNNILLNGDIDWRVEDADLRDQDRLHVELVADADLTGGGRVYFGADNGNSSVTIKTGGGDISVESTGTLNYFNDTLNTASPFGGGDIEMRSGDDILASNLSFANQDEVNNPPVLHRTSQVTLTAENDVVVNFNGLNSERAVDFNGINPGFTYTEDEADIEAPSITLSANNSIDIIGSFNDGVAGEHSDAAHIRLNADADGVDGGTLTLGNNVFSGGGDITLSGAAINWGSNALNSDAFGNNDATETTLGGHITVRSSGDLHFNNVTTENDCGVLVSCGNFTVSSRNADESITLTQADGSLLQSTGVAVFNINEGDIEFGENNLDKENAFLGGVVIERARNVSITQQSQELFNFLLGGEAGSVILGDLHFRAYREAGIASNGSIFVGGNAIFSAPDNDIILDHENNDFIGSVHFEIFNFNNTDRHTTSIHIADQNDLLLGAENQGFQVNQNFYVSAGGDITQSTGSPIVLANTAGLATLQGGNITLGENNQLQHVHIMATDSVALQNNGNLNLLNLSTAENATLNSATLTVIGGLTQTPLNQGGDDIVSVGVNVSTLQMSVRDRANLELADNAIAQLSGDAGAITLQNSVALALQDLTVTGQGDSTITLPAGLGFSLLPGASLDLANGRTFSVTASAVNLGDREQSDAPAFIRLANNSALVFNQVDQAYLNSETNAVSNNTSITVFGTENDGQIQLGEEFDGNLERYFFNAGDGQDTLISHDQDSQWLIKETDSELTQGNQHIQFNGITQLQGGSGEDTIASFNGGRYQWTLGNNDTHQLASLASDNTVQYTVTFSGMDILDGQGSTGNTLQGTDSATEWQIAGDNLGTVTPENGAAMVFIAMDSLVGGSGNDTFNIEAGATLAEGLSGGAGDDIFNLFGNLSGVVDGGTGADRFNLHNAEISATISGGEESDGATPDGSADDNSVVDVITGFQDRATTWTIGADGAQSIVSGDNTITLNDFERLQGSDDFDDTFQFENGADIATQIDGGTGLGHDVLNYFAVGEQALNVTLGMSLSGVVGIEEITGNGDDNSTLTIADDITAERLANDLADQNVWSFVDENSGTVTVIRDDVEVNTITFGGFANFAGEAADDTFAFELTGLVSQSLNGGNGANQVIGNDGDHTWAISADDEITNATLFGTAQNIGFIQGGAGDDRFEYANQNSAVGARGGDGNDIADFSSVTDNLTVRIGNDAANELFGVEEVETLIGNGSENLSSHIILLGDQDAQWTFNALEQNVRIGEQDPIQFQQFNQVTGGGGQDSFTINSDLIGLDAAIRGGLGNDQFTIQAPTTVPLSGEQGDDQFHVAANIVATSIIDGGAGTDSLHGPDQHLQWIIGGTAEQASVSMIRLEEDGTLTDQLVTRAASIDVLVGGSQSDTFSYLFAHPGLVARGGAGEDRVDYAQVSSESAIEVVLGRGVDGPFSGIEAFTGHNGEASQIRVEGDVAAQWTLSAADEVVEEDDLLVNVVNGTVSLAAGAPVSFSGFRVVQGGDGEDVMTLSGAVENVRFAGGNGTDTLIADGSSDNFWRINADGALLSKNGIPSAQDSLTFTQVENLQGADAVADNLIVTNADAVAQIVAGDAEGVVDRIVYRVESPFDVRLGANDLQGFERLQGNELGRLIGSDQANVWHLSEQISTVEFAGKQLEFQGFGRLLGGQGDDQFHFADMMPSVDGGGGQNQADFTPLAGPVSVGVHGGLGQAVRLANIQSITADPQFRNVLLSGAGNNLWQINQSNQGQLSAIGETLDFTGFNELRGVVDNQFVFAEQGQLSIGAEGARVPGAVRGGTGQNVLTAFAGRQADWLIQEQGGGQFTVTEEGLNVEFSAMNTLQAGDLDDHFTLAEGSYVAALDGGAGANTLQGSAQASQWIIDSQYQGNVTLGQAEAAIEFNQIHHVVTGSSADIVTLQNAAQLTSLHTGAGGDRVTVQDNSVLGRLATENGIDEIVIQDSGRVSGTVLAGAGRDTVRLSDDGQLLGGVDGGVQGAEAADLLDLSASNSVVDVAIVASLEQPLPASPVLAVAGFEQITALGNNNQLRGVSTQNNRWVLTGPGVGTLDGSPSGDNALEGDVSVGFSGFARLLGGNERDDFILAENGSVAVAIMGGGGVNSVTSNAASNQWNFLGARQITLVRDAVEQVVVQVDHVVGGAGVDVFDFSQAQVDSVRYQTSGGGGADQIWAPNQDNRWNITELNTGSITSADDAQAWLSFSGVEHLVGGQAADRFTVADGAGVSGVIDGREPDQAVAGEPHDILDLSAFTGEFGLHQVVGLDVTVADPDIPVITIASIEEVLTSEGHQGRLMAGNEDNRWIIDGENSGLLNGLRFTGFSHLQGGDNRDDFVLRAQGSMTGVADGAAGDNTFTAEFSTGQYVWTLRASDNDVSQGVLERQEDTASVAVARFSGIAQLVAGDSDDAVVFEPGGEMPSMDLAGGLNRVQLANDGYVVSVGLSDVTVSLNDQIVTQLQGVDHLVTGEGNDAVTVDGPVGLTSIDLAGGEDRIDSTGFDRPFELDLETGETSIPVGTSNQFLSLSGLERLEANPNQANQIRGYNLPGLWQMHADYAGTASFNQDNAATMTVAFSGIQTLIAGQQNDTFLVGGRAVDRIQGGEGHNILIYDTPEDVVAEWSVESPDSARLRIDNQDVLQATAIAHIGGGQGEDRFVVTSAQGFNGVLDGAGGTSDSLVFRAGEKLWQLGSNDLAANPNDTQLAFGQFFEGIAWAEEGGASISEETLGGLLAQREASEATALWAALFTELAAEEGVNPQIEQLLAPSSVQVTDKQDFANVYVQFANIEALTGGPGDWLSAGGGNHTWEFIGPGAGSVTAVAGLETMRFAGFTSFIGGVGQDTFRLNDVNDVPGFMDGGDGEDSLYVVSPSPLFVSLTREGEETFNGITANVRASNIELLDGDGPENVYHAIFGPDVVGQRYVWAVDEGSNGSVSLAGSDVGDAGEPLLTYRGFSILVAGDQDDRFRINADGDVGFIDGGSGDGQDLVDYSNRTGLLQLTIDDGADQQSSGIRNVEGLIGNHNGQGNNNNQAELTGFDGPTQWRLSAYDEAANDGVLDGVNDGEVTLLDDQGNVIKSVVFRDFNHLLGGDQADTFTVEPGAQLTGSLRGGAGDNRVIADVGWAQSLPLRMTLLHADALQTLRNFTERSDDPFTSLHLAQIDQIDGNGAPALLVGSGADNEWRGSGLDGGQVRYEGVTVRFSQIGHWQGGEAADEFILDSDDRLSGWIQGGAGEDVVRLQNRIEETRLAIGADLSLATEMPVVARVFNDVESVQGDANSRDGVTAIAEGRVQWQLTAPGEASVHGVALVGFDDLWGGAVDDHFEVLPASHFAGIVHGGGGDNRMDFSQYAGDVRVALFPSERGGDFVVEQIQGITANTEWDNQILGGHRDTQWQIDGPDHGFVEGMEFSGFNILSGGDNDDVYTLTGEGAISRLIDGGGQTTEDVVDYSGLVAARDIYVGEEDQGIRGIERLRGNDQLRVFGPNQATRWVFEQGVNEGRLNYSGGELAFSGVRRLFGGNDVDTFEINGGQLSGVLSGGDGDDLYIVTVSDPTATLESQLNGQQGNDRVRFVAGGADLTTSYSVPLAEEGVSILSENATFKFTSGENDELSQSWRYRNIEQVEMLAQTAQFQANSGSQQDTFVLQDAQLTLNGHAPVRLGERIAETVLAGNSDDNILIQGDVALSNRVVMRNAHILSDEESQFTAGALVLDGAQAVGREAVPLSTDVVSLTLVNMAGPVYLREANELRLDGVNTRGLLNIIARDGNITQSATGVLSSNQAVRLEAGNGAIVLPQSNQLSGPLSLLSSGELTLNNTLDTQLAEVRADDMTLSIRGNLTSTGPLRVDNRTTLDATGNIELIGSDNQLSRVAITQAQSAQVVNQNHLELLSSQVQGDLVVTGEGVTVSQAVQAGAVALHSGTATLESLAPITSTGDVVLEGERINLAGPLEGGSITVAAVDSVDASRAIESLTSLTVEGDQVTVNAPVTVAGNAIWQIGEQWVLGNRLDVGAQLDVIGESAQWILTSEASVSAGNATLVLGEAIVSGDLSVDRLDMTVQDQVQLNGNVLVQTDDALIQAGSLTSGSNSTLTTEQGGITVTTLAGGVSLETVNTGGILQIESAGAALLNNVTDVASDLTITAANDVGLLADVRVGNNAAIQGGDVQIQSLDASLGNVAVTASGRVSGGALSGVNITAKELSIDAQTGVGSSVLSTSVDAILITNTQGIVGLENDRALKVNGIYTNGDINITNSGDLTLVNGAINAFYDRDNPLNPQTLGDPSGGGALDLNLTDGLMLLDGDVDFNKPHIAARRGTITLGNSAFAELRQIPVIYTPDGLLILTTVSWSDPLGAFGFGRASYGAPDRYNNTASVQVNINDIGASEQLVEVEALEDIDPAVFSAVKNYFFQDISVLLPEDQRYDEDEF